MWSNLTSHINQRTGQHFSHPHRWDATAQMSVRTCGKFSTALTVFWTSLDKFNMHCSHFYPADHGNWTSRVTPVTIGSTASKQYHHRIHDKRPAWWEITTKDQPDETIPYLKQLSLHASIKGEPVWPSGKVLGLSLIHISEPTRRA